MRCRIIMRRNPTAAWPRAWTWMATGARPARDAQAMAPSLDRRGWRCCRACPSRASPITARRCGATCRATGCPKAPMPTSSACPARRIGTWRWTRLRGRCTCWHWPQHRPPSRIANAARHTATRLTFWLTHLPDAPFAILGNLNVDPQDGDGDPATLAALAAVTQDPRPRGAWQPPQTGPNAGASGGDPARGYGEIGPRAGQPATGYVPPAQEAVGAGVGCRLARARRSAGRGRGAGLASQAGLGRPRPQMR